MSRKDEIWDGPLGVTTIAGGKLTGYRPVAREALERVAARTDLRLAEAPKEEPPLVGGDFAGSLDEQAAALCARGPGLREDTAARLVRLYGSEAASVVGRGAEPLAPGASVVSGEVDHAVVCEAACALEDVLYRRTRAALYEPEERRALVAPAAARMADLLGWGAEKRAHEVSATLGRMDAELEEMR
jgi:glycerol-3-phosphate dehydrogenase